MAHSNITAERSLEPPIWTFLPGLHGSDELFGAIQDRLPDDIEADFVNLPPDGKQDYDTLCKWLDDELSKGRRRLLIAESFSGPLAMRMANLRPDEISGLVLAASFCDAPLNPGLALLPLRPLIMVKPPRKALRHFLIGEDATDADVAQIRAVVQSMPKSTMSKRIRTILQLQETDNPPLPGLPMLILQANNDNIVPWEVQRKLEACYPDADSQWIESPHLILQRCPGTCIKRIAKFARKIDVSTS
ncbi:MAG: alpha/beta hydrolase [Verrucomicrobiae bacterium]|nr:alpha/beta hydrolase [Verrucomicrobiae bacterium]NNJ86331.1 alpha/beta hydrolase [Akkermansiaceae bacterium]